MARPIDVLTSRGGVDLAEEAFTLLRRNPARLLTPHLIGTVPYLLGLVYYWIDMGRSPDAWDHCAEAALALSLLYLHMKAWHTVYARGLLSELSGAHERWASRRLLGVLVQQGATQPLSLFLLPIALLVTIPFPWVWAFFHSLSLYGDGTTESLGRVSARAGAQARQATKQCIVLLFLASVMSVIVYLNVLTAILLGPQLLKTLFGIETVLTRSGFSILNTTVLLVCGCLTFLCVNPLLKAAHVLRCFYGDSLRTAEDLRVDLRRILGRNAAVLLLLVTSFLFSVPSSHAAEARGDRPSLSSQELDRAFDEVLRRREYTWRSPREEKPPEGAPGVIAEFLQSFSDIMSEGFAAVRRWWRRVEDWVRDLLPRPEVDEAPRGAFGWIASAQGLLYVLLALLLCCGAILALRLARRRRSAGTAGPSGITSPAVKEDDDLSAAALRPADEWQALASTHLQRGDLRATVRALFLACLSHLSTTALLVLVPSKTNREYLLELRRKARDRGLLIERFSASAEVFERIWYGHHDVSMEHVRLMDSYLNAMRNDVV